jgi:gas vesicle protein
MKTGKVILGTMAGLAFGAIAGILFAPEKGSATRKQISDKSDEFMNEIKSKLDEFSDLLSEKFKRTKKDAEQLVDKGKEIYDEAKKDVKNAAKNFQHDGGAKVTS